MEKDAADDDDTAPRPDVGSTKRARAAAADDDDADAEGNARALARAPRVLVDVLRDTLPPEMLAEVVTRLDVPGNLIRMEQVSHYIQEAMRHHWTEVLQQIIAAFNYFQDPHWGRQPMILKNLQPSVWLIRDALQRHPTLADIPDARKLVVGVVRSLAEAMMAMIMTLFHVSRYPTLRDMFDAQFLTLYMNGGATAASPRIDLMSLAPTRDGNMVEFHVPLESPLQRRPDLMAAIDTFNTVALPAVARIERTDTALYGSYVQVEFDGEFFDVAGQFFFHLLMDWSPLMMMRTRVADLSKAHGRPFTQSDVGISPAFAVINDYPVKDD